MTVYSIISSNRSVCDTPSQVFAINGKLYEGSEYALSPEGDLRAVPVGESIGSEEELEKELQSSSIAEVGDLRIYVCGLTGHGRYNIPDHPLPKFEEGTIYDFPWNTKGIDEFGDLIGRIIKTDKGPVKVNWIRRNSALPAHFPMGELVAD